MHARIIRLVALVTALGLAGPAIAADANSGPGKLSARATRTVFVFPKFSLTECPGSVLSVELTKGLHKRLLVADATVQVTGVSDVTTVGYAATFKVNGHRMQPTDPGWETSFGGSGFLPEHFGTEGFGLPGASGSAWIDLEAAEAAYPGEFIGKKLTVELLLCNWTSNADGNVTLGARLDRK
ncbi:MAG: hypothetical protein ACRERC_26645 [Candidatus Binatia bacterium]